MKRQKVVEDLEVLLPRKKPRQDQHSASASHLQASSYLSASGPGTSTASSSDVKHDHQGHGERKREYDSHRKTIGPFPIKPISRFNRPFPFFRKPTEIGHFSLDENRTVLCDDRLLKVYWPPSNPNDCNFDLRSGYKDFIKRDDDVKERLDNLTTWVQKNKTTISLPSSTSARDGNGTNEDDDKDDSIDRLNADFLMWRGHMTKFLCTPYENREGWAMAVTLFRGTYYISEVETEENRRRRKDMSDKELEMTYWGYKFEQYVTSDDLSTPPDTTKPVNNNEAYCSVVRTRLASHSLLYSGEVDCCKKTGKPAEKPSENYVELKTSRRWYTPNNERNFYRYKLLKMWAQSFLVGIPEVIVGFRDDDGVVSHIQSFKTLQMPNIANGAWDGAVCFNFTNELLSYIKEVVTIDDPKVVYMLERKPGAPEITCTLHPDGDEQFLSPEYIAAFK